MKLKKNIVLLFTIPVLMFGFGYLMVPIYDVFCEITGLNGKTGKIDLVRVGKMEVDESRMIKIEFMASLNEETPLDFAPTVRSMMVHPGKRYQTTYTAKNRTGGAMTGQAVPSVAPSQAAAYFDKVECFCFAQQAFTADQQRELPVVFVVHPKLPDDIETITLSYTFFEVATPPEQEHDHSTHDHNVVVDG